jgi:sulfite reductase alpha subunit-like flavoprotein
MGLTITILVGTMTGTADLVAEEVHDRLEQDGHDVEIVPMDGRDATVFDRPGIFLICSSTYGQGDVPDNAQGLFAALERERPDLSTRRFGVIALGDRTYTATFCHGGKRFDELLRALGAARIGEVMIHDASAGTIPEEVAVEWAVEWVAEIPDARDEAA